MARWAIPTIRSDRGSSQKEQPAREFLPYRQPQSLMSGKSFLPIAMEIQGFLLPLMKTLPLNKSALLLRIFYEHHHK